MNVAFLTVFALFAVVMVVLVVLIGRSAIRRDRAVNRSRAEARAAADTTRAPGPAGTVER